MEKKLPIYENISITRALGELKLLDKRIQSSIDSARFVSIKVPSDTYETTSSDSKKYQSWYDKINQLQRNRVLLKRAITLSNAKTFVKLNGESMTVADAIVEKSMVPSERVLLDKMKANMREVRAQVDRHNSNLDIEISSLTERATSKEKVASSDLDFVETYRKSRVAGFNDPLDMESKILELSERLDKFDAEVDYVLSESNSSTLITVYAD